MQIHRHVNDDDQRNTFSPNALWLLMKSITKNDIKININFDSKWNMRHKIFP